MRQPLRAKGTSPAQRISTQKTYTAPIGGWNARDGFASMAPHDAIDLRNWFPKPSYVESRGGSSSYATGLTGTGKTLAPYHAVSGTSTLYAYTESGIYDVSSAGAVGASKLARTNGKHQVTMFGDGSSVWLIAVNGTDKPAYFDGTTWTAVDTGTSPALLGVTSTDIVGVNRFKGRLFFLFNNSLKFGFLPAGLAGGTVQTFDLSGECANGGYLMAMGTWTRDAGDGADDVAVFVTSEGEGIIYQGTNPASASFWSKIGTFKIGKPLGRRCIEPYAGDMAILTEEGIFTLATLLQSGDTERDKYALSYKIQDAATTVARSYRENFGWRAVVYPTQNALLVNVPFEEDGTHEQYVMNTLTKAWCRFTGWDAEDFAVFNSQLYFVKGTTVYRAWTGAADLGANITLYGKQAFQDFGDQRKKLPKLFQPLLSVNANASYGAAVDMDFEDIPMTGTVADIPFTAALWGTAIWGVSLWTRAYQMSQQWSAPASWEGHWLSAKVKIETKTASARWLGNIIIYESGDSL